MPRCLRRVAMSRLVASNETGYPDAEVKRLIQFGLADLDLVDERYPLLARVVYTRVSRRQRRPDGTARYGISGSAHYQPMYVDGIPGVRAAWLMILRVGRPADFPTSWYDRYRLGPAELRDWRDALVAVAAHEGKHIESRQHGIGHSALGGRREEERCDRYALTRLRVFQSPGDDATLVA